MFDEFDRIVGIGLLCLLIITILVLILFGVAYDANCLDDYAKKYCQSLNKTLRDAKVETFFCEEHNQFYNERSPFLTSKVFVYEYKYLKVEKESCITKRGLLR